MVTRAPFFPPAGCLAAAAWRVVVRKADPKCDCDLRGVRHRRGTPRVARPRPTETAMRYKHVWGMAVVLALRKSQHSRAIARLHKRRDGLSALAMCVHVHSFPPLLQNSSTRVTLTS